jgi:alkyl hydroperoxide reductase subunit AhpF
VYSRNVGGVHEVPDGCVNSKAAGDADHDIEGLVLDLRAAGAARQQAARAEGRETWTNTLGTGLPRAAAALFCSAPKAPKAGLAAWRAQGLIGELEGAGRLQ